MHRITILAVVAGLAAATAGQANPPAAGTSARAADPRDRIICRRYLRTGSLADTYRTCKTRGEWDREQENVRQFSMSDGCRMRGDPDPANGGHTQDC